MTREISVLLTVMVISIMLVMIILSIQFVSNQDNWTQEMTTTFKKAATSTMAKPPTR